MQVVYLVLGRSGDKEVFEEWPVALYAEETAARAHVLRAQREADRAWILIKTKQHSTLKIELQSKYDPCLSFALGEVWYEIKAMCVLHHFKEYTIVA